MTIDDLSARLSGARFDAEHDDAPLGATVDGAGRLVALRIDPKAMRLDSQRLAEALADTVRAAQTAAQESLPDAVITAGGAAPDIESLSRLAGQLGAGAQQRLADISSTLDRLLARDSTPPGPAGTEG